MNPWINPNSYVPERNASTLDTIRDIAARVIDSDLFFIIIGALVAVDVGTLMLLVQS